ncbi:MAG: DUF1330 domain-containing protein [Thermoplasmata archaeon]|jgi:uncharacterized protein (DUF1330 family)
MPAYLVAGLEWKDAVIANEYRDRLGPTLEKYGGKTLVAGKPEMLEGNWNPRRVVVIEFPSMDHLQKWYHSVEYAPLLQLRQEGSTGDLLAVQYTPG